MGQTGFQFNAVATSAGFFSEALAQNVASATYNVPIGPGAGGPGRRMLIRAILAITDEGFGPEFNFFSSAASPTGVPDTDGFLGRFGFVSAMGEQLNAAGPFRYYVDGLAIPYFDADAAAGSALPGPAPQLLHVVLQNISATAKAARGPAAGRCHAEFWLEPETSW